MCGAEKPGEGGRGFGAVATAVLLLAFGVGAAHGQQRPEGLSLGFAVAGGNNVYVGEDDDVLPLPLLRYDSDRYSIGFPDGLQVKLYEERDLRIGAVVTPRMFSLVDSDAPELDGIERDITVDAGLEAAYGITERTELSARTVTEVTDEHGGGEIAVALRHTVPVGRMIMSLEAGATWQSASLSSYLYGIRSSEARAGREAYSPGEVVIPHLAVGAIYPLNERIQMISLVRAEFLPDEVTHSPIISDDTALGAMVGFSYRF